MNFWSKILISILSVCALGLTGCVNPNKIRPTSFKVTSVSPKGFGSLGFSAQVGIDNGTGGFSLSEITGSVYGGELKVGTITVSVDDLTVRPRTSDTYTVTGTISTASSVSLLGFLQNAPRDLSEYFVDISFKARPKGGAVRDFNFEKIPVKQLLETLLHGNR